MDIYCDFNTAAPQKNGHYKPLEGKEQLKTQLLSNIRSCLSYLLPRGTFHGNKFYVGDIYGNKGKSLVVELAGNKAGLWHDFATGEGGDVFDLWSAVTGKNQFTETIADIAKWLGYSQTNEMLGQPTSSWNYYDENDQVIVTVYRYDTDSGKRYIPFDVKRSSFTAPEIRPLYNIPGILKSDRVVLVEGEKCAESLIEKGITATTAMSGANAPIDKTDRSPLKGKHVIIWPDNDVPGKQYAEKAAKKLVCLGVASLNVLKIPQDKPKGRDVADGGVDVKEFLSSTIHIPCKKNLISFPARRYLNDKSPIPEDIIAPRILTPSGLLVFAGAPKVGKSDFLISWLFYMAAGIPFLDMVPKRPLKIFYLQTEVGYHYIRERVQQLKLDQKLLELAGENLVITPQTKLLLNENGVDDVFNEIKKSFDLNTVDIIAIDPLRNIFDAGENGNENDNNHMLFFLQERLEKLRTLVNPDSGIILVHHTKKICKKQLEEDPFQNLSGAGSLIGFYTTGMIMFKPETSNRVAVN
ncbi:MAG: hypothetical protein PG981_001495 [Wolbachia endosymbiont of Ctenocephalides orientis wCori]|nr:MAG: hypothetical protein PG981_001495 [Wolbachia endosymbiont of Ctenocephalides orientis wCori]